jgi:hypothetical protein
MTLAAVSCWVQFKNQFRIWLIYVHKHHYFTDGRAQVRWPDTCLQPCRPVSQEWRHVSSPDAWFIFNLHNGISFLMSTHIHSVTMIFRACKSIVWKNHLLGMSALCPWKWIPILSGPLLKANCPITNPLPFISPFHAFFLCVRWSLQSSSELCGRAGQPSHGLPALTCILPCNITFIYTQHYVQVKLSVFLFNCSRKNTLQYFPCSYEISTWQHMVQIWF